MKRSKLILGLSSLLLSGGAAFATSTADDVTVVWFSNNGMSEQTIVLFDCQRGEPTCFGVEGPSENKLLYLDEALSITLERK